MTRAIYFSELVLLGSLAIFAPANAKTITRDTSIHVNLNRGHALDLLIAIARDNHLPLGIVLTANHPCRQEMTLDDEHVNTVNDLLDVFNKRLVDYKVQLKEGTIVVEPPNLHDPVYGLLAMPINNFRPIAPTMESVNENLWMYIRATINPSEGTIASIPYSLDEPKLTNFNVPGHSSVEEILNILVQQNAGGAWLLDGLAENWRSNLSASPFKIQSYSLDNRGRQIYTCSN